MDGEAFRKVIGHFASGVTVITARWQETDYGITANAVTSVSLDPALVAVCVNRNCGTHAAIAATGAFSVSILEHGQADVAQRFATQGDKFRDVPLVEGELGAPLLPGALAHIECRVAQMSPAGTHSVIVAEVCRAAATDGEPLAYYRGRFGRLEPDGPYAVYADVRQRVLDREFALGRPIQPDVIATRLQTKPAWVHDALVRLGAEGIVVRTAVGGWAIAPISAATTDAANAARCAVELGVADLTVGRVSRRDLAQLRAGAEATAAWVRNGRFVDVRGYNEANNEFHEQLVSLARCSPLLDVYRRLCMPGIMARTLSASDLADDALIDDHLAIVDAYECADLEGARAVIQEHNDRAARTLRAAIERAGGTI